MAIDDGHGLPVVSTANTEVLEATVCLVRHEVADELALKDRHSIELDARRVVSVDLHMDMRSRSVRKQSSNPGMDVASWDVLADAPLDLAEPAQAKYVQRMNFERLGKV